MMNGPGQRVSQFRDDAPAAAPDAGARALRAVHRAASELRRGTPVLLSGPEGALILAAAETVSALSLAEMARGAHAAPVLLLAPVRAAAVLQRPVPQSVQPAAAPETSAVALRLPPALLDPATLRSLADPTAERLMPAEPDRVAAPALAPAAIALAKIARLLPALVAVPAAEPATARLDLLSVSAEQVLAYPDLSASTLARVAEARVPLEDAPEARIVSFRAADGGIEHLAILVGQPEATLAAGGVPLARIHSECFTGDLLGSLRCSTTCLWHRR